MHRLNEVRARNPHHMIQSVQSDAFKAYGRLISDPLLDEITENVRTTTAIPADQNVYVASDQTLEQRQAFRYLQETYYAQCPIQLGYCNGHSNTLKALEYHMGSEFLFAATPLVLVLGFVGDVAEGSIHTSQLALFYLQANDVVELYGTTLHHAPCAVTEAGFQAGIALLQGTNTPLDEGVEKTGFLWQRNKWLLACHDHETLCQQGVRGRIDGPSIAIK